MGNTNMTVNVRDLEESWCGGELWKDLMSMSSYLRVRALLQFAV